MQATVYNYKGEETGNVELDEYIFGIEPNKPVMHQALVRQLANARQGTHDTKTRAEVSGGNSKPYRQKGTGRARQGSTRSPQWRHGGVVFGPHPRSYEKDMPRKMRRLAIRSALSQKLLEGSIIIVGGIEGLEPKTKAAVAMLGALGASDKKALVLVPGKEGEYGALYRSVANIEKVTMLNAAYLNIRDLVSAKKVIIPTGALEVITRILSQENERHAPGYYARREVAQRRGEDFVGMREAREQAIAALLEGAAEFEAAAESEAL